MQHQSPIEKLSGKLYTLFKNVIEVVLSYLLILYIKKNFQLFIKYIVEAFDSGHQVRFSMHDHRLYLS